MKWAGVIRRPATRSTWDLEITANAPATLTTDYTIKDDLGSEWTLIDPVSIVIGPQTVTFTAVLFGPVSGASGSEITQVTFVPAVTAVQSLTDATVGQDEETDEQINQRWSRSVRNPSVTTTGRMFAALANVGGVTEVEVYENDSDVYDAVRDIEPHTLWCVIEGGTVADIAEVIALNKTGGTGLKGTESATYNETRTRPDGTTYIKGRSVRFDRVSLVDLFVRVTATTKSGDPVDGPAVADAIATQSYRIGETAAASELYEPAYEINDDLVLTDLEISLDGIAYTDETLAPGFDGRFTISADNVTVL